MIVLREYLDTKGRSAYAAWFDSLSAEAAAKVTTAVTRISLGNFSNVEGVGSGVFEYKLDLGPGYRIYFGKDGETLVILLGGERKNEKAPAARHQRRACQLAGLQTKKVGDFSHAAHSRFQGNHSRSRRA
jgi:putative addiction module killer protein